MAAPIIENIVRQHAEQAAFLWTQYDADMQAPVPEDAQEAEAAAEKLSRLLERLEAHLDGMRVAGEDGLRIAEERLAAYREPGELFLVRMLQPSAEGMKVVELDLEKVREYLAGNI